MRIVSPKAYFDRLPSRAHRRGAGSSGVASVEDIATPRRSHSLRRSTGRICLSVLLVTVALTLSLAASALAAERPLKFVHQLRDAGYADMAVVYLDLLAKRPDMPAEVREVWNQEMSLSLEAEAAKAFDAKDRERLLQKAQQHRAKFIQEKPGSEASATAILEWGKSLMNAAIDQIATANKRPASEKDQRKKGLADARKQLDAARDKFKEARQTLKKRLDSLPDKTADDKRQQAELELLAADFQLVMVDYYAAQTLEPDSRERTGALKDVAEAFDNVFQRDRDIDPRLSDAGLMAHRWHGKAAEELGDLELADDIYQEVLANPRNSGKKGPANGWEPWFADVEYLRLMLLARQDPHEFISEASEWLKLYRRLNKTDGYQGVWLEVAKAQYGLARKAKGSEKGRRTSEALQALIEVSKVRSQYQQEAILLKREILKASGKSEFDASTFDEAVALADAALSAKQWERARDTYAQALELAGRNKMKDKARLDAVREAAAGCQFMLARDMFTQGQYEKSIEMTGPAIFEDSEHKLVRKSSKAAAQASALAVSAALNLFEDAPAEKRAAASDRLIELAKFTETNWPDLPEADDARMDCGRAKLWVGDVRQALDIFERVNPKSQRYPLAMYSAGQCYVSLYVAEKQKPENARDAKQMAADLAKGIGRLTAGLEELKRQFEPGKPPPRYYFETQHLLAQLRVEAGELKQAAELYQSLVDLIKAERPKQFDKTTVAIFLGAVRVDCSLGQLEKAGDVGRVLIELGPDTPEVNMVLVQFTRLLDEERKKAAAAAIGLESAAKVME
ncbi:MAG: hypothetical protein ABFC96_03905, partial [Thermoguttaceae bacterium]